eukprot:2102223-Alexandrium_andersonii.AAC.1
MSASLVGSEMCIRDRLYGVDGKKLDWMGSCSPKLELPSGKSCSVEFDITNTSKPIMSVGKGVCRASHTTSPLRARGLRRMATPRR